MSPKRTKVQQRAKIAKRAGKRERRIAERIPVRCDDCGLVQPLSLGRGGMHADGARPVGACLRCGGHYGTYA